MNFKIPVVFCIAVLFCVNAEEKADLPDALETTFYSYLKTLSESLHFNASVVFSQAQYHPDGSIKQVDALGFAFQPKDNAGGADPLEAISKEEVESFEAATKSINMIGSLVQAKYHRNGSVASKETYGTIPEDEIPSGVVNVLSHELGLEDGLLNEAESVMELSEKEAILELLQYFESGKVKQCSKTIMYPKRVEIKNIYKMPPRLTQEIVELLRKAYKQTMTPKERIDFICDLFDKKFPNLYWQGLLNASAFYIPRDASITIKINDDEFTIIGIANK